MLNDLNDIKRLQRIYGYYLDRSDWDNVVDLLTDDATAEYASSGVYVGKASIKKLLYAIGYDRAGLPKGLLREHMQFQLSCTFRPTARLRRGGGACSRCSGYTTFLSDLEKGWSHGALPAPGRSDSFPPDRPPTEMYEAFPTFHVPAFHYNNPVTGRSPTQKQEQQR